MDRLRQSPTADITNVKAAEKNSTTECGEENEIESEDWRPSSIPLQLP